MSKRDVAMRYDEIVHATVPEVLMFGGEPHHTASGLVDPTLENRVRAAFAADSILATARLDVIVRGSCVQLLGTVPGPGTAAYAEDIARCVDGVMVVDDKLVIEDVEPGG